MRHTHSKVPLSGRTTLHSRSRTLSLSQVKNNNHAPPEQHSDVAREGGAETHTRA